ncbi:MAG TPA: phospholipase D-like domain-containing protein [Syntrophorhabdales bacterium]|nr:phospholipase D-like domain-containing protein [Syntrophorhabdales bacterium]
MMNKIFSFFFFSLLVSIVTLGGGCATLPNVTETINEAPTTQAPPQIASAKGLLSPKQSKALMERLQRSVDPTDMLQRYSAVIESVSESPLTKGNKVTLLVDGAATYAAMFKAVENARDHINIETYTMEDIEDETGRKFADLLLQKQAEGLQVNLIYDSLGSFSTPAAFFQRLRDGGIQVLEFNPQNPLKAHGKWRLAKSDHRKILIVDGKVAITGGVNISQVYSSGSSGVGGEKEAEIPWRDTDVQIEGPAVAEFQKLFLDTWQQQKGPKLPDRNYFPDMKEQGNALVGVLGSTPGEANRITFIMYVAAITFAENSLHMTNAYFVPDSQILKALTDAAKRGVDVKIILPGATDRSLAQYAGQYHYSDLLKSGVRLYKRRNVLLHAKTLVIDDVWSTVGSTNMEWWSFSTNDEVNAVILNREFAMEMEKMFARDLAESDQIRWEEWKKRPLLIKIREWFSHLFAHRSDSNVENGFA